MEMPKNQEEFECLMRVRAAKQSVRRHVKSAGMTIKCLADGKPDGEDSTRALCEFSKLALGTKHGWVECGPVNKIDYGSGYDRELILRDPESELLGDNRKGDTGIILVIKLVTKSKKPAVVLRELLYDSDSPGGYFCAVGGGCK